MSSPFLLLNDKIYRRPRDAEKGDFPVQNTGLHPAGGLESSTEFEFFDTLDGKLFKNGAAFTVYTGESGGQCYSFFYQNRVFSGEWSPENKIHFGAGELPGKIRKKAAAIFNARKIFPVFKIRATDFAGGTGAGLHELHLTFITVREGSVKNIPDVIVSDHPSGAESAGSGKIDNIYTFLIECSGIDFGKYNVNAVKIPDTVTDSAGAFRELLQQVYHLIIVNEAGVMAEIDSECLHDFRVVLRKLRTLFAVFNKAIQPEIYQSLKAEMGWISTISNSVRDLDVLLLLREKHRSLLSKKLLPHYELFYEWIAGRRSEAFGSLVSAMQSARYQDLKNRLQNINIGESADLYVFARTVTRKKIRKVLRAAGNIHKNPDPEKIHDLRKEVKKLRYLLEFFSAIEPENGKRITSLKKLQETLGLFTDARVQKELLNKFIGEYSSENSQLAGTGEVLDILAAYSKKKYDKLYNKVHKGTGKFVKRMI